MTSWINARPIKRIFKEKIEKIEKIKHCYEPYLFNHESGRNISNNIRKFGIYLTDIKKIVNVYKPYYKKIPASGLGDFIRGSYFLYQYCKLLDIEFEVNMKYHMINTVLDNTFNDIESYILENIEHSDISNCNTNMDLCINTIDNVNSYLLRCNMDENGVLYVCMKVYPMFIITEEERLFFRNIFKYKVFKNIKEPYRIIHIRSGDRYLIDNEIVSHEYITDVVEIIEENMKDKKEHIILIGDSNDVKNKIIKMIPSLLLSNNEISHMGEGVNVTLETVKNNMEDFYIMSKALSILSISMYEHGSGFSKWCAETYSVPYTAFYF